MGIRMALPLGLPGDFIPWTRTCAQRRQLAHGCASINATWAYGKDLRPTMDGIDRTTYRLTRRIQAPACHPFISDDAGWQICRCWWANRSALQLLQYSIANRPGVV